MAHYVICSICKQRFDRDKVQAVKTGARRYAHQRCCPSGELVPLPEKEIDPDLIELENYIKKLLKEDFINARVRKQIKDFQQEYGYSYSGMLKSLIYFYEVKGNSTEKANGGIGIIPFVYKDAYNYYLDLFLAKQKNQEKNIKEITHKIKEITIRPPSIHIPKKLFNFDKEEEE